MMSALMTAALGINVITFATYFWDKAASTGRLGYQGRGSEASLHALSLFGGWPGALLARHIFRHKTRKQPFVTVFWITAAINVAAVLLLAAGASD